jgi:hypothetical protein
MGRNEKNTRECEYNCGGYALGTFCWIIPYTQASRTFYNNKKKGNENFEKSLEHSVNYMLKVFKDKLRVIEDLHDLRENEYAIAYRMGEVDFHFMRRKRNGHWYHKMGMSTIQPILKEDVFSPCWYNDWGDEYNSRIVLLAVVE